MKDKVNTKHCDSCIKSLQIPPCAIYYLPKTKTLIDILLNKNNNEFLEAFICPVNAQNFDIGKIAFNNNCLSCNLCVACCIHNKDKFEVNLFNLEAMQQILFESILTMTVALNIYFQPNYIFYPEVSAKGHARNKRIDIVATNKNLVFIIKIIKDVEKVSYYIRSYADICNNMKDIKHDGVYSIFLVPSGKHSDVGKIDYKGTKNFVVPFNKFNGFLENF